MFLALRRLVRATVSVAIVDCTSHSRIPTGDLDQFKCRTPGISFVDLWSVLKSNPGLRLSSYKLDVVAEKFLSHRKVDIGSYDQIFRAYDAENPVLRSQIATYCAVDSVLPLMLSQYFNATVDDLSLAVETRLPLYRIAEGGMSVRLMGRVSWECLQAGVAMNRLGIAYTEYQGARVIEPVPGYYGENPVRACPESSSNHAQLIIRACRWQCSILLVCIRVSCVHTTSHATHLYVLRRWNCSSLATCQ